MNYVVPNMRLIPQDKTMSCWYASGQMLIQWRMESQGACEIAHPDPSLVKKWGKVYDNNAGINNHQIAQFADDLGLTMFPPATPSAETMKELLVNHGPLWVNGKTHITVIAGIRSKGSGFEVLVFDPANPAARNGSWHDFYAHYGLQSHTSLDAGAGAQTSILYVE